jgi:hypothetical protein
LQNLFAVIPSLLYEKNIGFNDAQSDPPIIGLSGGYHGKEGQEEGEEVLRDNRHIRLSR